MPLAVACSNGNEQGHVSANVRGDMAHADVPRVAYDVELAAACGSGGLTKHGASAIVRWPYLQKVTSDSADILFTTADDREIHLVAHTIDGEPLADVPATVDPIATPAAAKQQYAATLRDLPAHSIVCYQLFEGEHALTTPAGFRTAPAPDADASIRFVAFGDLGERTSDQYAVLEQVQRVPMDLAIITGDVAYDNGTRTELEQNFFGVYRPLLGQIPFFPASGNHDYKTEGGQPFREAFALFENGGAEGKERWYSFDWGPVHFVMLDTEQLVPEQQRWLRSDLSAHDRPWVIAVAHRPPYSAGSHGSDGGTRKTFSPIFAEYDVPLVLVGHEHDYERTRPQDGVIYVVTGGGGRGTRPVGEEDFTAVIDRVAHFVWIEADAQRLRMVAVDATGEPFDSLLLTH